MSNDLDTLQIVRELLGGAKEEPPNEFAAIARTLVQDRDAAFQRALRDKSDSSTRELIRATFVAIEGMLWQLKMNVLQDPEKVAKLTIHEQAALLEESYMVNEQGAVRAQPRFLPTLASIKLVARVLHKSQSEFTLDFSQQIWEYIIEAVGVRNRITHPKRLEDLRVTNTDTALCEIAFLWFTAFTLFVLEAHKVNWSDIEERLVSKPEARSFFRLTKTASATEPSDAAN